MPSLAALRLNQPNRVGPRRPSVPIVEDKLVDDDGAYLIDDDGANLTVGPNE